MKLLWVIAVLSLTLIIIGFILFPPKSAKNTERFQPKVAPLFEPNVAPLSGAAGGPASGSSSRPGKGSLELHYAGEGGAGGTANSAGGNGTYTPVEIIDPELEPQTRAIMRAMGGRQPTDQEWQILFPPLELSLRQGGSGGSISTALYEQMLTAHRVARAQHKPKATP